MKKVLVLIVTLVSLLGFAAIAQASSVSRTISDLTAVAVVAEVSSPYTLTRRSSSTDLDFTINSGDAEWVLEEIQLMMAFLSESNENIFNYFNTDIQSKIIAQLPVGFDPQSLQLDEFVTMSLSGYNEGVGDVQTEIEFPTKFRNDEIVVPIIAVIDDAGIINWYVLQGTVTEDGKLLITIDQNTLKKISESKYPFALGVLSGP